MVGSNGSSGITFDRQDSVGGRDDIGSCAPWSWPSCFREKVIYTTPLTSPSGPHGNVKGKVRREPEELVLKPLQHESSPPPLLHTSHPLQATSRARGGVPQKIGTPSPAVRASFATPKPAADVSEPEPESKFLGNTTWFSLLDICGGNVFQLDQVLIGEVSV